MMRCLSYPDCTVYVVWMQVCNIGSSIDEIHRAPIVAVPGAVYGECWTRPDAPTKIPSRTPTQIPTIDEPTSLPSQSQTSHQPLSCEEFKEESICRENGCAFFAENGSCESSCQIHTDIWAVLYEIGSATTVQSAQDCMMRCLSFPDCTVYVVWNQLCMIGFSIDETQEQPMVAVPGAIYGECLTRPDEPVKLPSRTPTQSPTMDTPTSLPSQSQTSHQPLNCEEFKDEATCRENGCAFFAENGSCESSCQIHEDTWAILHVIGSYTTVQSAEECMMRCLSYP